MLRNLPEGFGAFVISFIVVIAFSGIIIFAMVHGVQDNPTLQSLMGAMTASFVAVVQYWVGSSSGSKNKDAVIAAAATSNLPTPPPPRP